MSDTCTNIYTYTTTYIYIYKCIYIYKYSKNYVLVFASASFPSRSRRDPVDITLGSKVWIPTNDSSGMQNTGSDRFLNVF